MSSPYSGKVQGIVGCTPTRVPMGNPKKKPYVVGIYMSLWVRIPKNPIREHQLNTMGRRTLGIHPSLSLERWLSFSSFLPKICEVRTLDTTPPSFTRFSCVETPGTEVPSGWGVGNVVRVGFSAGNWSPQKVVKSTGIRTPKWPKHSG